MAPVVLCGQCCQLSLFRLVSHDKKSVVAHLAENQQIHSSELFLSLDPLFGVVYYQIML